MKDKADQGASNRGLGATLLYLAGFVYALARP